jgi:hypothetical protein
LEKINKRGLTAPKTYTLMKTITPPLTRHEAKALQAVMKIAAASVHINCAINKGLEAAEMAYEIQNQTIRKEVKELSGMVTRIRHDSKFLEKKFSEKEHIMDFLYDVFGCITEITDYLMLLEPDELAELRDQLKERTKNYELRL